MRRRAGFLWLAIFGSQVLAACQTVPYTGRSQLQLLSEPEETRMGLQAYREILRKSRISRDPAANDLVTRVGARIAAATGRTDYQWEFRVIDDSWQIKQIEQWLPEALQCYQASPLPLVKEKQLWARP